MARDAVNRALLSFSVRFSNVYRINNVFGSMFKNALTSHVVVVSNENISGKECFLIGLWLR